MEAIYKTRPFSKIPYDQEPVMSNRMNELRIEILQEIERKGGCYGAAASLYREDIRKGSYYIAECFDQVHHESTFNHWGAELVKKIIHFRLELIRFPLRLVMDSLSKGPTIAVK